MPGASVIRAPYRPDSEEADTAHKAALSILETVEQLPESELLPADPRVKAATEAATDQIAGSGVNDSDEPAA